MVTDPNGVYVDATVGGGGHARLIAARLGSQGKLIGCDRDPDAISHCRQVLPPEVELKRCRFSELESNLGRLVSPHGVAGFLFDLGVSSHQLDAPERGFSYRSAGPLDLRMDPQSGPSATELLASLSESELYQLIRNLGEDRQARLLARKIVWARSRAPITTTEQLARIVAGAVPSSPTKSLARVFQALRMAVNEELPELQCGLATAWRLLRPGGRLVVLSYHSLEDRTVKSFFRNKTSVGQATDSRLPLVSLVPEGRLLTRKPLRPSPEEIRTNPRSRSARLRAIEKLSSQFP